MSYAPVPEITAHEAAASGASGEANLLDVRDLDEVASASVTEEHIPLADLASRVSAQKAATLTTSVSGKPTTLVYEPTIFWTKQPASPWIA